MNTVSSQVSRSLWHNPLVVLGLLFGFPALLVLGGFFIVALYGQIPGGSTTECLRTLSDDRLIRIEVYGYTAGLTYYERQTFTLSTDSGRSWNTIFSDDVQAPREVSCADNIRLLDDGTLILFNSKSIALTSGSELVWQNHHVCDAPRPEDGRCDPDPLNIINVDFADGLRGMLLVQEGIVDEYGQPLFQDGNPRVSGEYRLVTEDGGQSWQLQSPDG